MLKLGPFMKSFVWKISWWCCLLPCWLLAQNNANTLQHPLLERGRIAFEKGQYAKAERLMDKLLVQDPTAHEAYYWKGKCAQQFEDYASAYEAYSTACTMVQTAPYFVARGDLLRTLGTIRFQAPSTCGDCGKQLLPDIKATESPLVYFKRAALDYEQATRLDPNHKKARSALQQTNEFIHQQ